MLFILTATRSALDGFVGEVGWMSLLFKQHVTSLCSCLLLHLKIAPHQLRGL